MVRLLRDEVASECLRIDPGSCHDSNNTSLPNLARLNLQGISRPLNLGSVTRFAHRYRSFLYLS